MKAFEESRSGDRSYDGGLPPNTVETACPAGFALPDLAGTSFAEGRIRKQALEERGLTASGRCWSGGTGTLPGPHGAVALLKGRAGREAGTCGESWVGVG